MLAYIPDRPIVCWSACTWGTLSGTPAGSVGGAIAGGAGNRMCPPITASPSMMGRAVTVKSFQHTKPRMRGSIALRCPHSLRLSRKRQPQAMERLSALDIFRKRSRAGVACATVTDKMSAAAPAAAVHPNCELAEWHALSDSMTDARVLASLWIDKFRRTVMMPEMDGTPARLVNISSVRLALMTQM